MTERSFERLEHAIGTERRTRLVGIWYVPAAGFVATFAFMTWIFAQAGEGGPTALGGAAGLGILIGLLCIFSIGAYSSDHDGDRMSAEESIRTMHRQRLTVTHADLLGRTVREPVRRTARR